MYRILLFSLFFACQTQPISTETDELPTSGNPLFDGWYADPEVAIFNDEYWIFPTYSDRFEQQVFFDCFSSPDLVNWTKHERILDTARVTWAREAMWAPCTIEKEGKYYFFFAANDIQRPVPGRNFDPERHDINEVGGIGVAVADAPEGPYEDLLGRPLIGEVLNYAQPIDQFVYEEDGQFYIIYGGWRKCNIAQLNDDFTDLVPFENGDRVKEITPEGYVEGPVLFKRDGWYYLMWSEGNWTDGSYRVAYGRSKNLTGPFPKEAIVLQSDTTIATGAGHHSVLQIPGTDEWYAIYHRRPIPNEDRDHRVTCIDQMYFDEAGQILPIEITFEGVNQRALK
ncbi:MAG: glycoside hydrolase family 43 protein [Bacteroidota bacterium]